MAAQYHFVVVVEEGKIFIDTDTTQDRFFSGAVWNPDSDNWEDAFDHAREYEAAQELLQDQLMKGTNN
jgi:hypothetical protein